MKNNDPASKISLFIVMFYRQINIFIILHFFFRPHSVERNHFSSHHINLKVSQINVKKSVYLPNRLFHQQLVWPEINKNEKTCE